MGYREQITVHAFLDFTTGMHIDLWERVRENLDCWHEQQHGSGGDQESL
jgi:hypothetical protein